MAYNAVAQIEHDLASNSSSDASRSPSPQNHAFPLRDADHLGHLETSRTADNSGLDLGSLIQSMTSASYDVVEDDDYDADPPEDPHPVPSLNTTVARSTSPGPPLRSPSSDTPIPLSHPMPDLQSLQGAYGGNVERLEQSAERLTSSTADIASEIRKMDQEQKRRSCSSTSNSINLRNGAFSPVIASPHGSTRSTRQRSVSSGSRLAQVSEPGPDDEGHFADRFPAPLPIVPAPPQVFSQTSEIYDSQYDEQDVAAQLERTASGASDDTYQQARTLFTDFDGVHFEPSGSEHPGLQLSLNQPPLASKPEPFKEPPTGENMVYYPAPVPRMLNLPPKLSRRSHTEREKRRTQVINSIAAADKRSALPPKDADNGQPEDEPKDRRKSTIPPQLRASVFFDPPSTTLDLEVKQDSAVATLDSILDASASAPVSAFTDHPYAGQVGSYVYAKSKRTTLSKNPPRQKMERGSQYLADQAHDIDREDVEEGFLESGETSRGHALNKSHGEHNYEHSEGSEGQEKDHSSGSEEEEEEDYVGPPNTLLAELQLRKQELKQRQRTIVPKPTQGMQHTLLEMDAMAQKQSEKRRRRPVTLAWDSRDAADDDDIPLAMLYPEKTNTEDQDRPVGLMEKRHLEENEPLSTRRARLRGEPVPERRPTTVYTQHAPEPKQDPEESGDEIETLAERLKRLRGQDPAESDFAHDLLAEIDSRAGITPKETAVPNENETLAQRRTRLQKENGNQPASARDPRVRRSMAALPQVRPTHVARKSSYDVFQRPHTMTQYGNRMSMQFPVTSGYQGPMGRPMAEPNDYGMMYSPSAYQHHPSMMGINGTGYTMPNGCGPTMARQPVDPTQRDVIDRWRQSIRY